MNKVELIGHSKIYFLPTSGIYKITNPKGKIYIGLSTDIYKRWESYKLLCNLKSQRLLYYSIKKYGYDTHKFEILEVTTNDKNILSDREVYWINYYNSFYRENKKQGLNLTRGGSYPNKQIGPKTKEHKRKIAEANKGKRHSKETKDKLRIKRALQIISEESYVKASKSRYKPCKLINKLTGEILSAESFNELSMKSGLSKSGLNKISKKETKNYKLVWLEKIPVNL